MSDLIGNVDLSKESVNPVDMTYSLILGSIIVIIIFYVTISIINSLDQGSESFMYDSSGCQIDTSGARITEVIYSKRGKATGENKCVKPFSSLAKYSLALFIALMLGGGAGSALYNIQFGLANPKLQASMFANQLANPRFTTRYS